MRAPHLIGAQAATSNKRQTEYSRKLRLGLQKEGHNNACMKSEGKTVGHTLSGTGSFSRGGTLVKTRCLVRETELTRGKHDTLHGTQ